MLGVGRGRESTTPMSLIVSSYAGRKKKKSKKGKRKTGFFPHKVWKCRCVCVYPFQ